MPVRHDSGSALEGECGMKGGILGSVIHKLTEPDEPKRQQITEFEFDDIVRQLQMCASANIVIPENYDTKQ
jgi:hypothetical protein